MKRVSEPGRLLLAMTALAALAACSRDAPDANNGATRKASAAVIAAAAAKAKAEQHKRELVAGVSSGKPGAPVDLRFELAERPAVGVPLTISIELTPRAAIGRLQATVQGSEGIQLSGDVELETADQPTPDVAVVRKFTVTPTREGVFYISVIAYASEAGSSSSRSFAIPIVVGDGGAAAMAQKPATVIDSANERIERMPAQETSGSR